MAYIVYLWLKTKRLNKKHQKLQSDFKVLENKINSFEREGIKYKINPHLFKNILNSIQSHAYQTYFSLDKLSNVLNYILYETDKQFVSVKEEMDFALNLIEINKLKLSPLFDIKFFLLQYAQKMIHNNESRLIIVDYNEKIKQSVTFKENIRAIEQLAPNHIALYNADKLNEEFLKEKDLLLMSRTAWNYFVVNEPEWLAHVPSLLIIKNA